MMSDSKKDTEEDDARVSEAREKVDDQTARVASMVVGVSTPLEKSPEAPK